MSEPVVEKIKTVFLHTFLSLEKTIISIILVPYESFSSKKFASLKTSALECNPVQHLLRKTFYSYYTKPRITDCCNTAKFFPSEQ